MVEMLLKNGSSEDPIKLKDCNEDTKDEENGIELSDDDLRKGKMLLHT